MYFEESCAELVIDTVSITLTCFSTNQVHTILAGVCGLIFYGLIVCL